MALITCPECSKEVSDQAKTCPNCAHPLKKIELPKMPAGKDAFAFLGRVCASKFGLLVVGICGTITTIGIGGIFAGALDITTNDPWTGKTSIDPSALICLSFPVLVAGGIFFLGYREGKKD